jgi:hypothetical protein
MLIRAGHIVYCPVVQFHPLVKHSLFTDWQFWERIVEQHLSRCDEMVVLMLDGWESSTGVEAELKIARDMGLAIRFAALEAEERRYGSVSLHAGWRRRDSL